MKNNKLKYIYRGAFLLFLAFSISSCRSGKTTVKSDGDLVHKSQTQLLDDVIENELLYRTINGKMNVDLSAANSKKGMKVSAVVKLVKDSIIQISFRGLFGVEGMRLTLTPDTLCIIDRLNKKYVLEDVKQLGASHSAYFNFYNLQALFTNSIFVPGEERVTHAQYKSFNQSIASGMYLLKTSDKSGIIYNFAIDASDRIASTLILSQGSKSTVQWSYSDFIKDGSYTYPTVMKANISAKNIRFDVNMSYSKLNINEQFDVDTSVPSKYTKVSIQDIVKMIAR